MGFTLRLPALQHALPPLLRGSEVVVSAIEPALELLLQNFLNLFSLRLVDEVVHLVRVESVVVEYPPAVPPADVRVSGRANTPPGPYVRLQRMVARIDVLQKDGLRPAAGLPEREVRQIRPLDASRDRPACQAEERRHHVNSVYQHVHRPAGLDPSRIPQYERDVDGFLPRPLLQLMAL